MVRGFLGPEREEGLSWICGYLPHRGPDAIHCSRDAIWHGFMLDDACEHAEVMMSCCNEHLPQMKLSADFVHPLKHPCAIPGSLFRWPENYCYTEWDESAEFAAEAELVAL
jgi:hypothetical protein